MNLHQRVDGDHALAFGNTINGLISTPFKLIAETDGQIRQADDGVAQRVNISGRFAAHAAENRGAAQPLDHIFCLLSRQWRDADGDILEHFDENAAQAA